MKLGLNEAGVVTGIRDDETIIGYISVGDG